MKKLLLAIFFVGFCTFALPETSNAQIVPAIKKAGKATWKGTKYVGRKTGSGAKYVGKKSYEGGKYGVKKGWTGTKYVGKKTWGGTKWIGRKTRNVVFGKPKVKVKGQ